MTVLPDFLVIGRMKSGSTTLSRWLAAQPEVFWSRVDEPNFFSADANWERGIGWYSSLFAGADGGRVLGECSPDYTHPELGTSAAERIRSTIPQVRLIYLLRDPVERIRSHYRHARTMGDESATLLEALERPGCRYVLHSQYHRLLLPYIERFDREQIAVVRLEDLTSPEGTGWRTVLAHLGLPWRDAPGRAHNVSEDKGLYRDAMRMRRNVELRRRLAWVPRPARQMATRLLRRRGPEFDRMLEDSRRPVPRGLVRSVWEDVERLEAWLGTDVPLWPRDAKTDA